MLPRRAAIPGIIEQLKTAVRLINVFTDVAIARKLPYPARQREPQQSTTVSIGIVE
jgi:hypothetical protein